MNAEWKDRSAFAEYAETIGVSTDHIIAVIDPLQAVLYSTNIEDDEPPVMMTMMVRDEDGILKINGPAIPLPNFWTDLIKKLREA